MSHLKYLLLLTALLGSAVLLAEPPVMDTLNTPVNVRGSGEYGDLSGGRHVPFGVSWRKAKPADFIWFVPATLGGTVGTAVGNVIGWPSKAVWSACHGATDLDSYVPPNDFSTAYFGVPGAYLVGGPFWCLKKAFVDFPVWLFGGDQKTEDEEDD